MRWGCDRTARSETFDVVIWPGLFSYVPVTFSLGLHVLLVSWLRPDEQ